MDDFLTLLGVFGYLCILALGIAQLYVGFLGIEFFYGSIWAFVAIFLAFFLRFVLPCTIGSYFGAVHVLGWEWYFALAFAAPGIIFLLPAVVGATVYSIFEK